MIAAERYMSPLLARSGEDAGDRVMSGVAATSPYGSLVGAGAGVLSDAIQAGAVPGGRAGPASKSVATGNKTFAFGGSRADGGRVSAESRATDGGDRAAGAPEGRAQSWAVYVGMGLLAVIAWALVRRGGR